MKKFLRLASVVLVMCLVCSVAFASWVSPVNTTTKKATLFAKGGLENTISSYTPAWSTTLSGRGESITGVLISNGPSATGTMGTGGTVALYDSPVYWTGSQYAQYDVPAECIFEAYAAPNTTTFFDLHAAPITSQQGLYLTSSNTGSQVIVYTEQ